MIKLIYRNMAKLFNGMVRKGIAFGYGNDHYLIVIDEELNSLERMDVLKHELAHILLGHCDSDCEGAERERREAEADEHCLSDAEVKTMLQSGMIQICKP